MGIKLFKKGEGVPRKISGSYIVANFLTRERSKNVSLAVGDAKNHSETTMNVASDRVYFVLEGRLVIKKSGREFVAEPGDAVFIPKNTGYHFEGTFKSLVINSPAFNPKDEQISGL